MIKLLNCCAYGEFSKTRPIGPARWSHFDLFSLHKGKLEITVGDTPAMQLQAGCVLLIFPDTPFLGRSISRVARVSVCHFELEDETGLPFANITGGHLSLPGALEGDLEHDIDRTMRLAQQVQTPNVIAQRETVLRSALLLIAQQTIDTQPTADAASITRKPLQWAREHMSESICIEELAEQVDLSVSHFRTVFSEQAGTSPMRAVMDMRVNEAARLLRETNQPIKSIAVQVGYPELPNFYRVFRSRQGMTPAKYRKVFQPKG